jgi:hypothetical protein
VHHEYRLHQWHVVHRGGEVRWQQVAADELEEAIAGGAGDQYQVRLSPLAGYELDASGAPALYENPAYGYASVQLAAIFCDDIGYGRH